MLRYTAEMGTCEAWCVKLVAVQCQEVDGKGTGLDGGSRAFQKSHVR